jgi:hypothetical protein
MLTRDYLEHIVSELVLRGPPPAIGGDDQAVLGDEMRIVEEGGLTHGPRKEL